ncbi:hypothetical protein EV701_14615 [Chthoniobacter flavus]|nr:hypothetical protein EV701_14615 [Chthoniobacter flavus]
MWPVVFAADGIHRFYGYSWRPFLDYFELAAALIGLICCGAAPFFTTLRVGQKWVFLAGSLTAYAADFFVSAFLGMIVFGIPMD